jgi:hypothetical protein
MLYPHPPRAVLAAGNPVCPLFLDRKAEALSPTARAGAI